MRRLIVLTSMLLVVAACGGSDDGAATTVPVTTIATTSAAPATTTAPVATVPVTAVPLEVSVVGTDITYAPDRALDVLAPAVGGPWPVVVVAPGFGQGKSDMKVLAEAVAAEGAVVYNATVEYSRDGAVMPDSIEALACAIRYARATAADYGGDPGWITLVGNSAGAASGAVVALDGDAYPRDGCMESESSAVVNGFVGWEGPYAWVLSGEGVRFEDTAPDVAAASDPYAHLGSNLDLVVRLVQGDDIDVEWWDVPPEVAVDFHEALLAEGYDVQLVMVDGAGHMDLNWDGSKGFPVVVEQIMQVARG